MKKYTVQKYFSAIQTIEVIAESKEDAIGKANDMDTPKDLNDVELVPYEEDDLYATEVIETEELEDTLDNLIYKAEEIVKEYYHREECDIDSIDNPELTYLWSGFDDNNDYVCEEPMHTRADSYYVEDEEIRVHCKSNGDCCLSELTEVEQLYIVRDIIKSGAKEGIAISE